MEDPKGDFNESLSDALETHAHAMAMLVMIPNAKERIAVMIDALRRKEVPCATR